MGKTPIYQIKEYGSFITGKKHDAFVTLPESTFQQLEGFILSKRGKDTDALELMGLSARKGIGKVITAKNYVGVIALNNRAIIEILPKIHSDTEDGASGNRIKQILLVMMKALRKYPFKSLQASNMDIVKMNILEIFIRMFVDEVHFIVKRGLKRGYETMEENAACYKGKMKFHQQIKLNQTHKEKCFVEYDNYAANRPENQLLKATLLYLYKFSCSSKNKNDIKILLNVFSDVEPSLNHEKDFAKYIPNRNMRDYSNALHWSRIFLKGKSFSAFAGSEAALALLFPMETLFENYISVLIKNSLNLMDFSVSAQDKSHYLFDEPAKGFLLKPDIVVKRKCDSALFVVDTKWKILSDNKANHGISQADIYQMYVYHKRYGAKNAIVIYPQTDKLPSFGIKEFKSADGVTVQVRFVDLFDIQSSISDLKDMFSKI